MRHDRWWWAAVVVVIPVLVGTVAAVMLLLAFVHVGTDRDRIELIRTGLAIGAGAGGLAALALAGRRQWSMEQAHRVTEQSVADAKHDAGERRITDLYSKAADQLGSDKAAVRLAGLYSLERLAQDTPTLRQTIVNLLCAYLRMPFTPPPAETRLDALDGHQELEVRRTVQRILHTHLRPVQKDTFWPDIDLELSGAVLYLFDMIDVRIRRGLFGGATFIGWTRFFHAQFVDEAIFGGARFESVANFASAEFNAEARFRGTRFDGPTRFDNARFYGPALFGGMREYAFGDKPDGATFTAEVTFTGAEFATSPVVEHVQTKFPLSGPGWTVPATQAP